MKTILVVEDNDIIREDVAEMLGLANYNVLTAVNGKEGLEKAYLYVPDLVVSDIAMPIMDGFGMLHVLRKDPRTEEVPFIFLTSRGDRTDFRNAMESGADDYITKPFNGDELLKAVENRFKKIDLLKRRLNDELQEANEIEAASATATALEKLPDEHDTNTYLKKQVIYKEGHTPHYLYYVKKGKVRTFKTHEDGKQLVMDLYNTGDFLGHVALLEEVPYKETAEAMEESELTLIPRRDFEKLLHTNAAIQQKLVRMLAKNISENEQHLLGIAYNTLRKKVAVALSNLYNKYNSVKSPYFIDISRDELASIAGTATESLIRSLTEFKNEGLIDIKKDNKIEITNPKKLANLLR